MNCYNCKNIGCALCVPAYDYPGRALSEEEAKLLEEEEDRWTNKERLTKADREFLLGLSNEVIKKKARK